MKLYICTVVLSENYVEGQGEPCSPHVLLRFLDAGVQSALGFRGEVKASFLADASYEQVDELLQAASGGKHG